MDWRWGLAMTIAVISVTCARPSGRPATERDAPRAGEGALKGDASSPLSSSSVDDDDPPLPREPPRLSPLETSCDGKDEDGDGHRDMLVPSGANACRSDGVGACGQGWALCSSGKRVCVTAPPTPEVADGIDNDCNGVVDDVPVARVQPRALVLGPEYIWRDAKAEIASVTSVLDQSGIPYDVNPQATDWTSLQSSFGHYALLIVPGYLESAAVTAATVEALERFATGGGVVVVMKPMGTGRANAVALAGLKTSHRAPATSLLVSSTPSPALASFDSAEERSVPLTDDAKNSPVDVWTFEVEANTQVLAEAMAGGTRLGAVATRRPVGRGAVYAWGHDLTTFDTSRCYLNCFEPSGDLLRLFLVDALREGARGHLVIKSPIPGAFASALLLTHDVSATDGFLGGAWGEAGVLQMAAMEKRNDARGTFFLTTDAVRGEVLPEIVRRLCRDGFCPVGANSARHLPSFRHLPRGTCTETKRSYGPNAPATVCGEVRTSLEALSEIMGAKARAWRSPYLANPPGLFDVLSASGVVLDSSFGVGDLKYNLPVDAASTPRLQRQFHHRALVEFPIAGEDAAKIAGDAREELDAKNVKWFESAWEYTMLQNAANASVTTLLVHPSRGQGAPDENIATKVDVVEHLIRVAKAHGIVAESLVHFGEYWRARAKVTLDASFDPVAGYTGWFQAGDEPVSAFTLEFGDRIASFVAPSCGPARIHKKRVVMQQTIPQGTRCTFTALPRGVVKK